MKSAGSAMTTGTKSAAQGARSLPWSRLTRSGRLRRSRQLAEVALERYDLPGAQLHFLRDGDNLLYRVATPTGGRFLLRVQEPSRRNTDELRSELLWLSALRHDGGLAAPEPIPTQDGALVAEVSVAGVPQPHYGVLLRWVEGRRRVAALTPEDARLMGAYTARLHQFARSWPAPEGFVRPRWDPERWLGSASPLWTRGERAYTADDLGTFEAATQRIRRDLSVLGESPDTVGLIHADLAPSNFVFRAGATCAIDFEECGWGYYLFDIAVALTALEDYGAHDDRLQAAFLDGYRGTGPLPTAVAEFRETFMALVLIKIVAWLLSWEDPALRPRGPSYLAYAVDRLRQFVERPASGPR